jgi:lysyl endopeptidase
MRSFQKKWWLLGGLVACFFHSEGVWSQLSSGGVPSSFSQKGIPNAPLVMLPQLPAVYENQAESDTIHLKPLIFAYSFDLSYDMEKDGRWDTLADGRLIWRIGFVSPGAYSLNVIFSTFDIPAEGRVFLYDLSKETVLGAFTSAVAGKNKVFPVMPVPGECLIVEYNLPAGVKETGMLEIGRISHDFRNIFHLMGTKDGSFGMSGECNLDINCAIANDWQLHKHSVCRLLVNGNELCSGVLLNNTAQDGKPYLYTVNHCIGNQSDAATTLAVFNYESPYCNGPDATITQSLSSATLHATSDKLDFTLMELNSMPPASYHPYYAGWKRIENGISSTVCIHYPQGDVKKFAQDNNPPVSATYSDASSTYDPNAHWKVNRWDIGTTEAGSSGSPLFEQTGLVVGILTGGDARCGKSINDYFAKTARAWSDYADTTEQLVYWLDPLNTGAYSLAGYNPYSSDELNARYLVSTSRQCQGDEVVFTDFSSGDILQYDWQFGDDAVPPTASGPGPHKVTYNADGVKNTRLIVYDATTSDTMTSAPTILVNVPVTAGFSYAEDLNHWIRFTDQSTNAARYYWDFGDNATPVTQMSPEHRYANTGNYETYQRVSNQACTDTMSEAIVVTAVEESVIMGFRIYPQPADRILHLEWDQSYEQGSAILFDVTGRTILSKGWRDNMTRTEIPCGDLAPGVYTLRIYLGSTIVNMKVVITHKY